MVFWGLINLMVRATGYCMLDYGDMIADRGRMHAYVEAQTKFVAACWDRCEVEPL
jgi:hypothetical protein